MAGLASSPFASDSSAAASHAAPPSVPSSSSSPSASRVISLLLLLAALLAQYSFVFAAASTTYSQMAACTPDGFSSGFRYGWAIGACFTDEQLWCRAHGARRRECAFSDCRAEEVRISLAVDEAREVYTGCTATALLDELRAQVRNRSASLGLSVGEVGPCVPADDSRAPLLPRCEPAAARCRGRFYTPRNASAAAEPQLECDAYWAALRAAG
ncbi:hypothetical protein AB1Y20_002695 [Prymnesium parvum]|uniref:Uncharacterized protein n=1 Tax=Prymnesium parvum TaxID=97485 RepID=A0AB34J8N6_PRYPA